MTKRTRLEMIPDIFRNGLAAPVNLSSESLFSAFVQENLGEHAANRLSNTLPDLDAVLANMPFRIELADRGHEVSALQKVDIQSPTLIDRLDSGASPATPDFGADDATDGGAAATVGMPISVDAISEVATHDPGCGCGACAQARAQDETDNSANSPSHDCTDHDHSVDWFATDVAGAPDAPDQPIAPTTPFQFDPTKVERAEDGLITYRPDDLAVSWVEPEDSNYREGQKTLLWVRLACADETREDLPSDERIFSEFWGINNWFYENSYGKHSLDLRLTEILVLPGTEEEYKTGVRSWGEDASALLKQTGINRADYDRDLWQSDGFNGLRGAAGSVGGPHTWAKNGAMWTLEHELGHNLGWGHANSYRADGLDSALALGGQVNQYGWGWDNMGSSVGAPSNMFQRYQAGWADEGEEVATVDGDGGVFTVYNMTANEEGALAGLRVVRPNDRDLWFEYRPHAGYDLTYDGLRVAMKIGHNPALLDITAPWHLHSGPNAAALTVGHTLSDYEYGIHITALEVVQGDEDTPDAIRVEVNYEDGSDNSAPTARLEASATVIAPLTADATADATNSASVSVRDAVDAEGHELSYAWYVDGERILADRQGPDFVFSSDEIGEHVVQAVISDRHGGVAVESQIVTVGAATGGRIEGVILDDDGEPVANAVVMAQRTWHTVEFDSLTRTRFAEKLALSDDDWSDAQPLATETIDVLDLERGEWGDGLSSQWEGTFTSDDPTEFKLRANSQALSRVQIFDSAGDEVMDVELDRRTESKSVNLDPGSYTIRVQTVIRSYAPNADIDFLTDDGTAGDPIVGERHYALTDSDGHYIITGLGGHYDISARAEFTIIDSDTGGRVYAGPSTTALADFTATDGYSVTVNLDETAGTVDNAFRQLHVGQTSSTNLIDAHHGKTIESISVNGVEQDLGPVDNFVPYALTLNDISSDTSIDVAFRDVGLGDNLLANAGFDLPGDLMNGWEIDGTWDNWGGSDNPFPRIHGEFTLTQTVDLTDFFDGAELDSGNLFLRYGGDQAAGSGGYQTASQIQITYLDANGDEIGSDALEVSNSRTTWEHNEGLSQVMTGARSVVYELVHVSGDSNDNARLDNAELIVERVDPSEVSVAVAGDNWGAVSDDSFALHPEERQASVVLTPVSNGMLDAVTVDGVAVDLGDADRRTPYTLTLDNVTDDTRIDVAFRAVGAGDNLLANAGFDLPGDLMNGWEIDGTWDNWGGSDNPFPRIHGEFTLTQTVDLTDFFDGAELDSGNLFLRYGGDQAAGGWGYQTASQIQITYLDANGDEIGSDALDVSNSRTTWEHNEGFSQVMTGARSVVYELVHVQGEADDNARFDNAELIVERVDPSEVSVAVAGDDWGAVSDDSFALHPEERQASVVLTPVSNGMLDAVTVDGVAVDLGDADRRTPYTLTLDNVTDDTRIDVAFRAVGAGDNLLANAGFDLPGDLMNGWEIDGTWDNGGGSGDPFPRIHGEFTLTQTVDLTAYFSDAKLDSGDLVLQYGGDQAAGNPGYQTASQIKVTYLDANGDEIGSDALDVSKSRLTWEHNEGTSQVVSGARSVVYELVHVSGDSNDNARLDNAELIVEDTAPSDISVTVDWQADDGGVSVSSADLAVGDSFDTLVTPVAAREIAGISVNGVAQDLSDIDPDAPYRLSLDEVNENTHIVVDFVPDWHDNPSVGENLLENGDFEDGLTHWATTRSDTVQQSGSTVARIRFGTEISQAVDVFDFFSRDEVDSGELDVVFGALQTTPNNDWAAAGQVSLDLLDGDGAVLAHYALDDSFNRTGWDDNRMQADLVSGTRSLVFTAESLREDVGNHRIDDAFVFVTDDAYVPDDVFAA